MSPARTCIFDIDTSSAKSRGLRKDLNCIARSIAEEPVTSNGSNDPEIALITAPRLLPYANMAVAKGTIVATPATALPVDVVTVTAA
jgi:hypothetical protein